MHFGPSAIASHRELVIGHTLISHQFICRLFIVVVISDEFISIIEGCFSRNSALGKQMR